MSQGLIPDDIVQQIKERADIVDLVSSYVSLSKSGQNFKGLCPFHTEKTPSFMVSPSRQIFHCFGCGAGGNAYSFLMRIEGKEFPEAVREMGRRTGIPVPQGEVQAKGRTGPSREKLELILSHATSWFHRNLLDAQGTEAKAYLAQRGIQPATIEAFGLGWAIPEWDGLLKALGRQGVTPADLAEVGLAVPRDQSQRGSAGSGFYDRFRGRVMFPIRDLRKTVIAFGGRVLGDGLPKYLNSSESALFSKGRTLFALDVAREALQRDGRAIIVEGYLDAIALHQAGVQGTVATLGTALTSDHVALLRRFVKHVVLLFDPDAAGVRASLRALDMFVDSGIGVTVVSLPDGHDPDTYIRAHGPEAFRELEKRAPSLLDYAVTRSLEAGEAGSMDDRIRSVDEILRILQKSSNRIEKEEYLRRVSERLGISHRQLIDRYPELTGESRALRPTVAATSVKRETFRGATEERDLVHLLLHGQLTPAHVRALRSEDFSLAPVRRMIAMALCHVGSDGRVLIRPMLDEALGDPMCASIATALSMEEPTCEDVSHHVAACLATLERKRDTGQLQELIAQLRRAEQEGRLDEAKQLNLSVNALRAKKAERHRESCEVTKV